jgi:hypothetical protein
MATIKQRGRLPFRARVPIIAGELAHWNRSTVRFQWLLVIAEATTGCRFTRGTRWWRRRSRLRPGAWQRHDWRTSGGAELWDLDDGIDLLQLSWRKGVREGRLVEVKEIEERRRAGAHPRRRIWPGELAGGAESGEGFRRFQGELARGRKGCERWHLGAFIGGFNL